MLFPPPVKAPWTVTVGSVFCGDLIVAVARVLEARFIDDMVAENLRVAELQSVLVLDTL